ncbi:MAG TPA: alpha-amylase family glycosyl hydrolase [Pyrinomonadaceae bacterium]|nr:alpha-amylase family glycosyl hydrolase [Pyrinomonadaceae bacterium]
MRFLVSLLLILSSFMPAVFAQNQYEPIPYVKIKHPEWARKGIVYQINTRAFTKEGTFRAVEKHLPRIKELGADILWIMPINPIGEKNRKGTLGSPYSVKDYYGVNPEFGTMDDFKHLVAEAHKLGFHVILDWVANHTAWDNKMQSEHPDWYDKDWKGEFRPTPWFDWTDIINLNYKSPGLRKYMTEAMKYWVKEADIDGYRCDVAGFVPIDFWNNLRKELDQIKPVFMLAEWESRDLHEYAFDMTYAWTWYERLEPIAQGKAKDLGGLYGYYSWNEGFYPRDAIRLVGVSNHDKNAWDGTEFELFGKGLQNAMVLSVVGEGMPMIYNGQEAGNMKRLKFFEKDEIIWKTHPNGELYKKLFALKKSNSTLLNWGHNATMNLVPNSKPDKVFSFARQNEKDKIFVVLNFSNLPQTVTFKETLYHGNYTEYFTGKKVTMDEKTKLVLQQWSYNVFVK